MSCQLQCTALEVGTAVEGKATHSVCLGQWWRRRVGRPNTLDPTATAVIFCENDRLETTIIDRVLVVRRAAGASTEPQVGGRRHEEAVLNLSEARVRAVVQAEANRRTEVG